MQLNTCPKTDLKKAQLAMEKACGPQDFTWIDAAMRKQLMDVEGTIVDIVLLLKLKHPEGKGAHISPPTYAENEKHPYQFKGGILPYGDEGALCILLANPARMRAARDRMFMDHYKEACDGNFEFNLALLMGHPFVSFPHDPAPINYHLLQHSHSLVDSIFMHSGYGGEVYQCLEDVHRNDWLSCMKLHFSTAMGGFWSSRGVTEQEQVARYLTSVIEAVGVKVVPTAGQYRPTLSDPVVKRHFYANAYSDDSADVVSDSLSSLGAKHCPVNADNRFVTAEEIYLRSRFNVARIREMGCSDPAMLLHMRRYFFCMNLISLMMPPTLNLRGNMNLIMEPGQSIEPVAVRYDGSEEKVPYSRKQIYQMALVSAVALGIDPTPRVKNFDDDLFAKLMVYEANVAAKVWHKSSSMTEVVKALAAGRTFDEIISDDLIKVKKAEKAEGEEKPAAKKPAGRSSKKK